MTVRLASGTAERDGTELALNVTYKFRGPAKSKVLTWRGCELEFEATAGAESVVEHVAPHTGPDDTPQTSYLNLHFLLDGLRRDARARDATGPRVLIAGPRDVGKTSLARTLAALAVRTGAQPLVVNTDPREGMLSLPGTLTAAVYATVMDLEGEGTSGWGGTPTSGPSAVPVKLPIAQYYGRRDAADDPRLYGELASKLAGAVTARMGGDVGVRSSGMIIDTPGVGVPVTGKLGDGGVDALAHIVDEFSVNIIVVLGSAGIHAELQRRFGREKTSLGEPIGVVLLDKSDGAVERDEGWMQEVQEATIKEYFFGDSNRTLSPFTQQVDFDGVAIYRIPERGLLLPTTPFPSSSEYVLLTRDAQPANTLRKGED